MAENMDQKIPIGYKLTPEAVELIEALVDQLGLTKQGVVEMAIREYAVKHGLRMERARGK